MKQAILYAAFALVFTLSVNEFSYAGDKRSATQKQVDSQSETIGDSNSQTQLKMQSQTGRSNNAQNARSQSLKKSNTGRKATMKKW